AVLVLVPFHVDTQFADPLTIIRVKDQNGAPQPVLFRQGRTTDWLPRIGGRYENRKSWFEFGYEQGPEFNGIRAFNFTTVANGLISCMPTAEQSLQSCVNANKGLITPSSRVTPEYQTKGRRGI